MTFDDFFALATGGRQPYPYQRRLAEDGLPDVLHVPTGAGKTAAATLPWLYRRLFSEEPTRWLVIVLPQRTLVEQTVTEVRAWVDRFGVEVPVHVLMGGEDADHAWKTHPERTRIFVGTQDMVLSRLLMRGFAESRMSWPMSFGLLHAGTQYVFDEVQLMGPGLPTSLQLQGLREGLGVALPCRSMWMSATVEPSDLRTVDFTRPLAVRQLEADDRDGGLRTRLDATRTIGRLDLDRVDAKAYPGAFAERVCAEHRLGTRTLVIVNTVDRAVAVHAAVRRRNPAAAVVLLHSRFRPGDRAEHTARATQDLPAEGCIVIATQVLEAGVDITSETLITETAPWSSIVQRAGRCNRDGLAADARLLWVSPPPGKSAHLPYDAAELDNSGEILRQWDGRQVTSGDLAGAGREVTTREHPILRRRDLRDLFDTAADLGGSDIDVSPFIRDADDRTVFLAWRDMPLPEDAPLPARGELCPAPLAGVRDLLGRATVQVFDQRDGRWRTAVAADVRPTALLIADAAAGGYDPDTGFDAGERRPVPPVPDVTGTGPVTDAVDLDPQSTRSGRWISLADHLADTEREARGLSAALGPEFPPTLTEAIALAARLHDIGKAHPTFANSLINASVDSPLPDAETVWAKSPSNVALRPEPRHFRHELAGALLLLDSDTRLLRDVAEADLVVYLVLSHHGKIRLTVRAFADEAPDTVLGVQEGSCCLPAKLPDGVTLPTAALSLQPTKLGCGSLTDRALRLRDRPDLGPFRLAFCEALVRSADWRASAYPGRTIA